MFALNNRPSQNFINISHLLCTIHRLETFGVELMYKLINFNERHLYNGPRLRRFNRSAASSATCVRPSARSTRLIKRL